MDAKQLRHTTLRIWVATVDEVLVVKCSRRLESNLRCYAPFNDLLPPLHLHTVMHIAGLEHF